MSYRPDGDYALEVARGNIAGVSVVHVLGHNENIDSATDEDIWAGGGTWVAPTAARVHQIVSTSTDDDGSPAGIGALTIRVHALTGWGAAEVTEDIVMNGTTDVPTAAYVMINRLTVLTKGATNVNVGIITATADTDATVTAQINAGRGSSEQGIYGLPSTQTLYITRMAASIHNQNAGSAEMYLLVNPEPDVETINYRSESAVAAHSTGETTSEQTFNPYLSCPGPAIIKLRADAGANNLGIVGSITGYLVTN